MVSAKLAGSNLRHSKNSSFVPAVELFLVFCMASRRFLKNISSALKFSICGQELVSYGVAICMVNKFGSIASVSFPVDRLPLGIFPDTSIALLLLAFPICFAEFLSEIFLLWFTRRFASRSSLQFFSQSEHF